MDYSLVKNQLSWTNSEPGIAAHALIAPLEWFEELKSPVAPFTELGDEITIKTAHTFKAGKGFIWFALAPQKNSHTASVTGDLGFFKQIQTSNVVIPGSSPAIHALYQKFVNQPLVVLLKDSKACGKNDYMQLGSKCEPAYLGGEYKSGTSTDPLKGFEVEISYDGPVQYYIVAGGPEILPDPEGGED